MIRPNTGLAAGTYTAIITISGYNGINETFNVDFMVSPVPDYTVNFSTINGNGTLTASADSANRLIREDDDK